MRDRRWDEARKTFRQVRTETGNDEYLEYDKNDTWYFAKEPLFDYDEVSYIKTSWVVQDLKTIDIMEYRERTVEWAQSDEQKAEAMYQLASALFEADDLTFYNPAAWHGSRGSSLTQLQFSDHIRLPNESQIIFEHLQVHDPWARAIPIYLEIVDRFPKTKTARDALYSAAVAHQRLSERNGPWGAIYERGLFAGSRMVTYADVRGIYPNYQLPRGTYGWEPSTRTVNGGPGWASPPKPPPRLTRAEKAEALIKRLVGEGAAALESTIDAKIEASNLFWRRAFDALLPIVSVLAFGYGAFVVAFFWKTRGPVERNELSNLFCSRSIVDKLSLVIKSKWYGDS